MLAGSLAISALAAWYVGANIRYSDQLRYRNSVNNSVREIGDHVRSRMERYITLLRGAAGLFSENQQTTRAQFDSYVTRLRLPEHYPGIQGIGYAPWIKAADEPALVAHARGDGDSGFHVWPGASREHATPVQYLWPRDARNLAAIGYDMYSGAVRREAIDRARDTAAPAATARVTLVQEIFPEKQAGFLIFVPVYRTASMPPTIEQRRAEFVGVVYSPFRADDLLGGITDNDNDSTLEWTLYDGNSLLLSEVLHRSTPGKTVVAQAQYPFRELKPIHIDVAGRIWTVAFEARPEFGPSTGWGVGLAVFFCGVALSLVLFGVTRSQVRARTAAEASALELRRSQQAVRASEHRFRTLFEQSPLSIQIFAPNGRTLLVNHAWEELWGTTASEVEDYNVLEDPQLFAAGMLAEIRKGFTGQTVTLPASYYDPSQIGRKGRPRWVSAHLYPVLDAQGAVQEVVVIHQDVTRVREAEEERVRLLDAEREARAQAEAANRTKDEFLATLSHEMRTPLNAILGWAQLLRMGGVQGEDVGDAVETIERNARAQAQLVEDLLDLSRIITGKLRLDARPVDFPAIVEAALDAVRPTATARGVRIIPVLDSAATPVLGDPNRLQQVVWNLLSNAIKFTPAEGKVEVCLSRVGNQAELVVSDTGMGISADFLPHVFERLRQADSSSTRRHGGLGLGLAIVRHLVELHGGTVRAQSRGPGLGATFTVTLPLASKASTNGTPRDETLLAKPTDGRALAGVRVLVVDDEPDARKLASHILELQGARVTTAASAREALREIGRFHPHVLLGDINMPGEDGYAMMRQVRALPASEGGRVPAIALTAMARQEDRKAALLAGFQLHLAKPIEPEQLSRAIAGLVRDRAMREED